jgi:hypothetical protein
MPRIKFRDFSGGLALTPHPDAQPRNTLRIARNIAAPTAGRLRSASGYVDRYTNVLASLPVDGMFRFQGNYYAEGTITTTRHLRRHTAGGAVGAAWTAVTFPAAVGADSNYDPTADDSDETTADGTQPAILGDATHLGLNSKFCTVLAPPIDGAQEMMFLADTRSTARGQLFKIETAIDGATSRWGILPLVAGDVGGIQLSLADQEETFINVDAGGPGGAPTDPIGEGADINDWVMTSGDEDALSGTAARTYVTNRVIETPALLST